MISTKNKFVIFLAFLLPPLANCARLLIVHHTIFVFEIIIKRSYELGRDR